MKCNKFGEHFEWVVWLTEQRVVLQRYDKCKKTKKYKYKDKTRAYEVIQSMTPKKGKYLNVYKCKICKKFHIGNSDMKFA